MAKFFSSLLSTLYWPVVGFFVLAVLVYVIAFVATIERSATGGYFNSGGLKAIAFMVAMLAASVLMKQRGSTQLAHLILFVPFGLVLVTVLLFFLMAYAFGKGS
jgi:hypothetical protein